TFLIGLICFELHWTIGLASLLILIPFGICAVVMGSSIYCLAQRAIVVRKVSIGDGLAEGVTLFTNNIGKNVVMFLIYIGLLIGLGIGEAIIWAIFGIPIAAIILAAGFGIAAAFVAAFVMGLPISLIVGGFVGTVLTNLYTIFYFELLEPSQPTTTTAPPAPDLAGA
ncbi:MAG: hypothetical protein KAT79_07090, partial [candidate division Zixibacteria bacterium]|nr:hypothetical protein [candidate division Zixibacteria bacterium]